MITWVDVYRRDTDFAVNLNPHYHHELLFLQKSRPYMTAPNEFPYITSIHVNDCYTYQDFDISFHNYKPFSHLILTGKNGSGKSTILKSTISFIGTSRSMDGKISIEHTNTNYNFRNTNPFDTIFPVNERLIAYFEARRKPFYNRVSSVTIQPNLNHYSSAPSDQFLQYLVNKKVEQAFDQINNLEEKVALTNGFFEKLEAIYKSIYEDVNLRLFFNNEIFDFSLLLSDGQKLSFNELSEGFSALMNIIIDLLIRTDIIRKEVKDYSYNPCGIVLIDEPENHLHLELQEQVLPLLTELFPNIQFIVATHSPAVIASIKNATIFDLTTKETRISEATVGRSYSELTTSHFGLENDYSTIADEYLQQVDTIIDTYANNPAALKQHLVDWQQENQQFLSPILQVKLEYIITQQDAKLAVSR